MDERPTTTIKERELNIKNYNKASLLLNFINEKHTEREREILFF